MKYGLSFEIIFSLIPDKPDNLDNLYRKENVWAFSTQIAFSLFINKDYTLTYKENNSPGLNYYNQFYYQGILGFSLVYDLHFKQTNLYFFKKISSSLDIPNY